MTRDEIAEMIGKAHVELDLCVPREYEGRPLTLPERLWRLRRSSHVEQHVWGERDLAFIRDKAGSEIPSAAREWLCRPAEPDPTLTEEDLRELISSTQKELDLCGVPREDHGWSLSIIDRLRMLRRQVRLERFIWYEGDITIIRASEARKGGLYAADEGPDDDDEDAGAELR